MNEKTREELWPLIEQPLTLPPDCIQVFRVNLDISPRQYDRLHAMLPEDERARAARYRFDEPRQRFVACRGALRQILAAYSGVAPSTLAFQYGPHGKPELLLGDTDPSMPAIEFNVSHSRHLGLLAFAPAVTVGIDIEECNPTVKILKLAERFFAPAETDELKNLPAKKQLAGFYRGWTCKEAYIKATGLGLSQSLSSFCVAIDPDQPAALREVKNQPDEPTRWTIKALDVAPDFAAAVMAAGPDIGVQCWTWTIA